MKPVLPLTLALAVCLPIESARAQLSGPNPPNMVSFQGHLADPGGTPITQVVNITTTLYKGGVAGYSQVHSNVSVVNGLFNVLIGPLDTVAFNQPIDVGVKVGTDPEISPRTPLAATPFALGTRGMYVVPAADLSHTGLNMIGGWRENYVAPGVVGATIAGGGGMIGLTSWPDSVTGDMGTVGGGFGNNAGWIATVGGGRRNRATDHAATIGGGEQNTALGQNSTIGGGTNNRVTDIGGTVAGGSGNEAGQYGAVGGGGSNKAPGHHATVPGGGFNQANADRSFAAGWAARANHFGSFVWAHGTNTNPPSPFASTGDNQFLIKAAGGVGIGTNRPDGTLDLNDAIEFQTDNLGSGQQNARIFLNEVGQAEDHGFSIAYIGNNSGNATFDSTAFSLGANRFYLLSHASSKTGTVALSVNRDGGRTAIGRDGALEMLHVKEAASTGIFLGGDGTVGPHGVVFDDDTGGEGVQLFWRTANNHFVLEKSSAGTGTDGTDVFLYDRDDDTFGFRAQVYPLSSNTYSLGRSGNVWTEVWATNGTIQTSDRRLKEDIRPVHYGLDEVLQLEPVSFRWSNRPDEGERLGLVAQDVDRVLPEVVRHGSTDEDILALNYSEIVPVLIKGMQEQQAMIEALTERLAALEGQHASR